MTRVGLVLRPELAPEEIVRGARAADDAGIGELWLWEDCFCSGAFTMSAAVLATTEHTHVGIGVVPTPMRTVAATAMEIAALARLHPGRLRVGLGHGVQSWMGQIGERVASPLTLLREQIGALTTLLDGGTVDTTGRYVSMADVSLRWPPTRVPPLLVGGTGPKTLALSGECSSGTILTSETSPDRLREALGHIGGGQDHDIVVYIACAAAAEVSRERFLPYIDAGATTVVVEPPADARDLTDFIGRTADLQAAVA